MMKLASTCPNSDMRVIWGLLCLHPNTIKPSYYYYYYYSFFHSFFCQKFVRHISQRLLNRNQWNVTGMLSTMSRCADYFRNFQNGRHFKMVANIKIKKIVKNSSFQWKWIFRGCKTCCTIWRPFWFAMAAIFNPKWPTKYKILRFGRNLVSK